MLRAIGISLWLRPCASSTTALDVLSPALPECRRASGCLRSVFSPVRTRNAIAGCGCSAAMGRCARCWHRRITSITTIFCPISFANLDRTMRFPARRLRSMPRWHCRMRRSCRCRAGRCRGGTRCNAASAPSRRRWIGRWWKHSAIWKCKARASARCAITTASSVCQRRCGHDACKRSPCFRPGWRRYCWSRSSGR